MTCIFIKVNTAPPVLATGNVTPSQFGSLQQYGYSNGYVGSAEGSISPDPFELEGNTLWRLRYDALNDQWDLAIRGVLTQSIFTQLEIVTDGGTVQLASADAFYNQNVPSDFTSWSWSSEPIGWGFSDAGFQKTITFT